MFRLCHRRISRQAQSCRLWFGAVVPLKSGFNGSLSFWTLKHCVYTAALWQPPQLGWLAVHSSVCPKPHAEARGLTSQRAQCPVEGKLVSTPFGGDCGS